MQRGDWLVGVLCCAAFAGTGRGRKIRDACTSARLISQGADGRTQATTPVGAFGSQLAAVPGGRRPSRVLQPSLRQIAYPMGDVPSYFGVCRIVGARLRALGIDCRCSSQVGRRSGDTNIDHRRATCCAASSPGPAPAWPSATTLPTTSPVTSSPTPYPTAGCRKRTSPSSRRDGPTGVPLVITTAAGACRRRTGCSPEDHRPLSLCRPR